MAGNKTERNELRIKLGRYYHTDSIINNKARYLFFRRNEDCLYSQKTTLLNRGGLSLVSKGYLDGQR